MYKRFSFFYRVAFWSCLIPISVVIHFIGCTPAPRFSTELKADTTNYKSNKTENRSVFQTGIASYYGSEFHGKKTASGELYNMYELTAAHPKLPFGTLVKVENLSNNKAVVVRINDRGPFKKKRIIDVSFSAAQKLGIIQTGTAKVRLIVVGNR